VWVFLFMKEEWKDVKGFEGMYQISNYGRLKSFRRSSDGYITSQTNKKGDYLRVVLKETHPTYIHHLVAFHFIGERPDGHHIDHIDNNKQNNRLDNLQYLPRSIHVLKTIKENPSAIKGMNNYNRFIRPKVIVQLSMNGDVIAEFANSKEASDRTGVCQRNILQVAKKDEYRPGLIRKQAGGFIWKFKENML
jgi:hypothetical protein